MNAVESLPHAGPVLRTRGLGKQYGDRATLVRALDAVELDLANGETVAVMGPSGCGKSTLLHVLGGLERPSAGEVWLEGRRIDGLSEKALARLRRRAIGFAASADRLISMRDGAFVEETRLTHGSTGRLGELAGLEG